MTSKLLSILLLLLLVTFMACDQSEDPEIAAPVPRIKEMTSWRNDTIISKKNYEYDQQGRLTGAATPNTTEKYVYEPGKVLLEFYWGQINKKVNYTLVLNNRGLLEHQVGSSESFDYDVQGYLIQNISGATFKSTIENGNLVRYETWSMQNGKPVLTSVITRTFFTDKPNTIGNENYGMTFYGKQDKNLRAKTTYISYSSSGTYESSESYSYEWDTRNRVVKRSTVGKPGNYSTYTYW